MVEPATAAAEAEAGVLRSLLEEEEEDPPGNVSLMANDTTPTQLDVNAIVAQQHAAAHQARAAAALEQADAEERHQDQQQQYHHHRGGDGTSQQLQHQVTIASTPSPIVTQDLNSQPVQSSTVGLPSSAQADLENGSSSAPGPPDLTLSALPPPSICLCQQPARIPRPRNAFILFRQHNQAAVVAQHPGKPNPEISKIIGEMWRESPQETKNIWQKHADEEKKQHLARYPEYRYQPRRNGKKNAAAAAAAFSAGASGALSPSIETTVCQTCGGRTGTLSTPQTPATPSSAVPKTPRLPPPPQISRPPSAQPPVKKRRTGTSEDTISQTSVGSATVDAAGVEALLQLGHLQDSEDSTAAALPDLSTPLKKRKHTSETSPMSAILSSPNTVTTLQHNMYAHFPPPVHDPNIDPFLRQNGFESESPTTTLDHEGNLAPAGNHGIPSFTTQLSDAYIIKSIPVLEKIHAFSKICKSLSLSFPRMPVVAVEGEDIEAVTELFHALAKDIQKSEPLKVIDIPDVFNSQSNGPEEDIGGLLIPSNVGGKGEDVDNDDADAAKYLEHVSDWRRRCIDIKKMVLPQPSATLTFAPNEDGTPAVVLVNRYMVSRSDVAAGRLSSEGLTPTQHWQWCATVWRGCVGADMTIVVNVVGEGVGSDEAVEVKEGGRVVFVRKDGGRKGWEEKVVRRLGFEVGEVVRSLRGFGG